MPERTGREIVPVGNREIVPRPDLFKHPEDEGGEARARAAYTRALGGGGEEIEDVVDGEFREIPTVRMYPGIRFDLETAKNRHQRVNNRGLGAVIGRLKDAGVAVGPDGTVSGYKEIEQMSVEEVLKMAEAQRKEEAKRDAAPPLIVVAGEAEETPPPQEAPAPHPEPAAAEANRLQELLKNQGQKLMEQLGSYSGGDLGDPDIARIRLVLESTGLNLVGLTEDQIKNMARERLATAKELLLAGGKSDVETSALDSENLMQGAQEMYYRSIIAMADSTVLDQRDSLAEVRFNRKGMESTARLTALKSARQRLGRAFDGAISSMDYYDNDLPVHRVFQVNLGDWLNSSIDARIRDYDRLTKDAGIREKFKTPEQWVLAVRTKLAEFEDSEISGGRDTWLAMQIPLETTAHYPQNVQLLRSMDAPELQATKDNLTREVEARAGIHAAWKTYSSYRTDADKLVSAMTNKVGEKEEQPDEKLKFFSMGWLDSLSTSEKEGGVEFGKRIGKALQKYMQIGELGLAIYNAEQAAKEPSSPAMDARKSQIENNLRALSPVEYQRYKLSQELASPGLTVARKAQVEVAISALPPKEANIFSDKLNEVAARRERDKIAGGAAVGKEAEEIAMRIIYLFGLGAKYSFSQDFDSFSRDDLASMMRPNEAWQKDQIFSEVPVGPYEIIGKPGVFDHQPMRYLSLLASYPDMVGEVLMRDGRVIPMMRALFDGEFDQVAWNEIPSKYQYNAYIRRMGMAKTVEKKLLAIPPGGEEEITVEAIKKFRGQVEAATANIRAVDGVRSEVEGFTASDGTRWRRKKVKRIEGAADGVTELVLYNKYLAIARSHNPVLGVPPKDEWDMVRYSTMRRNLLFRESGESSLLDPVLVDGIVSPGKIGQSTIAGAFSVGKK